MWRDIDRDLGEERVRRGEREREIVRVMGGGIDIAME